MCVCVREREREKERERVNLLGYMSLGYEAWKCLILTFSIASPKIHQFRFLSKRRYHFNHTREYKYPVLFVSTIATESSEFSRVYDNFKCLYRRSLENY